MRCVLTALLLVLLLMPWLFTHILLPGQMPVIQVMPHHPGWVS